MKPALPLAALALAALLGSCRTAPLTQPEPDRADSRAVLGFLEAYGRRDLDGMMRHLDEDAVFKGTTGILTKPQIRSFFQDTFRKHPDLRVEIGPLTAVRGTIRVRVKVQTDAIWVNTWTFELKEHRIRSYTLAQGTP